MALTFIRKRLIPNETVDISGDELLYFDGARMLTRWLPLKPRCDIGWGCSFTDIPAHCKISAFYDRTGRFMYWYCDIITTVYFPEKKTYIFTDLLADIRLRPGCAPEVLDLDELETAYQQHLIGAEEKQLVHETVDRLLFDISSGTFPPPGSGLEQVPPPPFFHAADLLIKGHAKE